ncbi:MAG: sulfotransferase domain-containing protein [Bacteroidota bacterium]
MKKNLLHYGLQRSGTNFLETLLLKNFRINMLNSNEDRAHPVQKHFRLYDEKELIPDLQYQNALFYKNFEEYLDSLELDAEIHGLIVVSKDPYSWLTSYNKWGKKCGWPAVDHHYAEEYNLFYSKWIAFAKEDKRIMFVRYYDLLTSPVEELQKIQQYFNLSKTLKSKFTGIQGSFKKVSHSTAFTSNRMEYYRNKEYLKDYSAAELENINEKIEETVFTSLGYELSNP